MPISTHDLQRRADERNSALFNAPFGDQVASVVNDVTTIEPGHIIYAYDLSSYERERSYMVRSAVHGKPLNTLHHGRGYFYVVQSVAAKTITVRRLYNPTWQTDLDHWTPTDYDERLGNSKYRLVADLGSFEDHYAAMKRHPSFIDCRMTNKNVQERYRKDSAKRERERVAAQNQAAPFEARAKEINAVLGEDWLCTSHGGNGGERTRLTLTKHAPKPETIARVFLGLVAEGAIEADAAADMLNEVRAITVRRSY